MSPPTIPQNWWTETVSPLAPAGILEKAGIKLCIVGNAALRLFGSDLLLADLDLAIADEQFNSALALLHNQGFRDIEIDCWRRSVMPVLGKPGGWDSRRLQLPSSSGVVVLTPASCWHMSINSDTTFLPHTDPYRFPHFLAYLEALIRILDALLPIRGNSLIISYHYAIMVELLRQRPGLRERMSPGDQFFMDFYDKQCGGSGELSVLKLRKRIIKGDISVETAREIVPRPDLARKRIKEKYERRQAEKRNGERGMPVV